MPLFSERVSMLEVQNRALKKTARERAERIDELERELQLRRELQQATSDGEEHIGGLQREVEQARQRARHIERLEGELQQMARELERLKAEREFYFKRVAELEEHNASSPRRQPNIHCGGKSYFANSPPSIRTARRGATSVPEAGCRAAPRLNPLRRK